jgi:uncharacterized protein (TIGR00375 family)
MKIVADFHLHSKYSRATARDLDLENVHIASRIKGVHVVATGDCSHPTWFAEIEAKLEPAEPGLYKLKDDFARACDLKVPGSCKGEVRFVLSTEISNIYKKDGRTRKNHNLVLLPDFEAVRRLILRLEAIGNIRSDGRPILGLDARDLLEVVLETSPDALLIPAHIWTPWFSILGSKSGFDSIHECFGDLTPHIHAAETGLSSDPEMNWRVSILDGIALVSNSDAHSPANIGREANLFNTDLSYYALREALAKRDPQAFLGTTEFFPEEGKYHLDGHRSCRVRLEPRETLARGGACPVCAKPLTVGVLSRVEELADRPLGHRPDGARPYCSLIPLTDILAEIFQIGPKSGKVSQAYRSTIDLLGPELAILRDAQPVDLDRLGIPLLGEAVRRMREKQIHIDAGFDGEYGKIRIFSAEERKRLIGQRSLFAVAGDLPQPVSEKENGPAPAVSAYPGLSGPAPAPDAPDPGAIDRLNAEQKKAVEHPIGPLMIVAGPGTGKTHTLTCRIGWLIDRQDVSPQRILALTFTHKAAEEMRIRLKALVGANRLPTWISTFHGFCWSLLRELNPTAGAALIDEDDQRELIAAAAVMASEQGFQADLDTRALHERITRMKQSLQPIEAPGHEGSPAAVGLHAVYRAYQILLESQNVCDFEDLIFKIVMRLEQDPGYAESCRERFRHVFIDEYQDINPGQYRLIRALVPGNAAHRALCVIGDPDQSIYGFRGSDSSYFQRFVDDYPAAGVVHLARNYRSTETILSASFQVISRQAAERVRTYSTIDGAKHIGFIQAANEHAEAAAVARVIEQLVGGTGFFAIDSGRVRDVNSSPARSYADLAVLARTHEALRRVSETFEKSGIPYQRVSRGHALKHPGLDALLSLSRIVAGRGSYADFKKSVSCLTPGIPPKSIERFQAWCLKNRLSLKDGLAGAARFPIPGLNRSQQRLLAQATSRISSLAHETAGMNVRGRLDLLTRETLLSTLFHGDGAQMALNILAADADGSEQDFEAFLSRVALRIDSDFHHPRAQKVALMSMHAAKGLEFPVVFIVGCEDGLVPLRIPGREPSELSEERRLFYVAMTRAKDQLYLSLACRRRIFGKTASREPSPFVRDIEARLLDTEHPGVSAQKRRAEQLGLF